MTILYRNFLIDKKTYHLTKAYWARVIKKLFGDLNGQTYFVDRFNNGKLFYDGNPIYSYYFRELNKGFRIIQEDPNEFDDEQYYTSWTEQFEGENGLIDVKVIVLILSKETRLKAINEIKEWVES